jgi:hypothetical protein
VRLKTHLRDTEVLASCPPSGVIRPQSSALGAKAWQRAEPQQLDSVPINKFFNGLRIAK